MDACEAAKPAVHLVCGRSSCWRRSDERAACPDLGSRGAGGSGAEAQPWKQACEAKNWAREQHGVLRVEVPPTGQQVLPLKWVFTQKCGMGLMGAWSVIRRAWWRRGLRRKRAWTCCTLRYAPTSTACTVRALFAVAAACGMNAHYVYVRTMLLNGELGNWCTWSSPRGFPSVAAS